MHNATTVSYVTTDSGRVIEVVRVSPVYVRFGPVTRGVFPAARLARSRRSDARRALRRPAAPTEVVPNVDRF